MAEFPALTLWTDAYLSDTRSLSTLEHGAYLLLLMEAWRRPNCDLPDDDKILSRLAGLSADEWYDIKDAILAFWTFDGRSKSWKQKRLLKERDNARARSKVQRDKAVKRWNKVKNDDAAALPEPCQSDAQIVPPLLTATAIEEEPNGSPSLPEKPKPVSRAHALPADWEPRLTPAAQRIVDGWPPGKFVHELARFRDHAADKGRTSKDWQAAFRTWITKYDEWMKQNGNRNYQDGGPAAGNRGFQSRGDGAVRAALRRMESYAACEPSGSDRRSDDFGT